MPWEPAADATTVRNPDGEPPQASDGAPYLTVLWHPDAARVGDIAPLPEALSRLVPAFEPPGAAAGSPLAEPHVSRTPVRFTQAPRGAVQIEASRAVELVVDGAALDGVRELDRGALARGVVLELAGRIALLLHVRQVPRALAIAGLVGASDAIGALCDEIERVADLDVPVLVVGETGSGKEHVARALHERSRRARGPFVAVNMATLASGVAAAQLFGHARGAFTGADRAHAGLFEQAHGGTLFLDEIGDTPADVQAMLLRVLESREVQPVGADAPRKVDVRVVAATDANLEDAMQSGGFRGQLYHRLAGYRIAVPPLRARADDVGRLLAMFLARELGSGAAAGRLVPGAPTDPPWLPPAALRAFVRHDWPGNVRELANVARHLAVVGRTGPVALEAALAPLAGRAAPEPRASTDVPREREITDDDLVAALAQHRWNTTRTAAALGISRTTLYALIERSPRIRKARDLERDEIVACRDELSGDLDRMAEQLRVSKRGLQLRMRELGIR